jgi:hypothetical protein
VYVRLSSEAERLRTETEKKRQKKLEEEAEQCTFTPILSTAFNKGDSTLKQRDDKDVFDRLSDVSKPPPTQTAAPPSATKVTTKKVDVKVPKTPQSSTKAPKSPPSGSSKTDPQPVFIKRAPKKFDSNESELVQQLVNEPAPDLTRLDNELNDGPVDLSPVEQIARPNGEEFSL